MRSLKRKTIPSLSHFNADELRLYATVIDARAKDMEEQLVQDSIDRKRLILSVKNDTLNDGKQIAQQYALLDGAINSIRPKSSISGGNGLNIFTPVLLKSKL